MNWNSLNWFNPANWWRTYWSSAETGEPVIVNIACSLSGGATLSGAMTGQLPPEIRRRYGKLTRARGRDLTPIIERFG